VFSFLFFPSTDGASDGHLTFSLWDFTTAFTTQFFDFLYDDAETLPFKNKPKQNKPKHPNRGNTKNKMEGQEDKRTNKEGESQGEHQVLEPPPIARSI
jgi:hypothetical protein